MGSHVNVNTASGSFLPVKLRSTKASEVCFKVKNFPLEIESNYKSLLKD